MLESTFKLLDTDNDGYITGTDFASVEISYCELEPKVDPFKLYKPLTTNDSPPRCIGRLNSSSFDHSVGKLKFAFSPSAWRSNKQKPQYFAIGTFYHYYYC
jgi:hypothetical protein